MDLYEHVRAGARVDIAAHDSCRRENEVNRYTGVPSRKNNPATRTRRTQMRTGILAVAMLGALSLSAQAQSPVAAPACDRACLEGYLDRYLEAMLANEVDSSLFAREVKFTENGIRLPLGGEGLWY